MKNLYAICCITALFFIISLSCKSDDTKMTVEKDVLRVGMVIKIKPEYIEEYRALHSDMNSGVRDLLTEANMHNFSIFLHQMDDGNWYEFGYYEYTGDDFEFDMAKLNKHPRNVEWLKLCDPMQLPLDGYQGWAEMEQIYYNQ